MSDEPQYTQAQVDKTIGTLIDKFEARLDAQEQVASNLMMGFVELSIGVEMLMKQALEPLGDKERRAFAEEVLGMRNHVMSYLNKISEELAPDDLKFTDPLDSIFTETLQHMAEGDEG